MSDIRINPKPDIFVEIDVAGTALPEGGEPGQVLTKTEDGAKWKDAAAAAVTSINGETGAVQITPDSIGAQPEGDYLTEETDPTVPAWAKQPEKPVYNAEEVGALPANTPIPTVPTNISAFKNDVGYLTEHQDLSEYARKTEIPDVSAFITRTVNDLENYYRKNETYSQEEIDQRISAIPKFAIQVVDNLPIEGISGTTVYLVRDGAEDNLYTEYIYVSGAWEILGSQRVDLTGYATQTWTLERLAGYQPKGDYALRSELPIVPANISAFENDAGYLTEHQDISGKLDKSALPQAVNDALVQVKVNGGFDVVVDTGAWELGAVHDMYGNLYNATRIRMVGSVDISAYDALVYTFDSSVYKIVPRYYDSEPFPGVDGKNNGSPSLNISQYDTSGKLTFYKSEYPNATHMRLVIAHIDDSAINVSEADVVSIVGTVAFKEPSGYSISHCYVNAESGSDDNDGTENAPKKTFAAAIKASGDNAVIVFEGDTCESINLKTNPTQKRLRIIGKSGVRNRILGGTKLDSFTEHASGVYYTTVSNSNLTQARYLIYQHDVNDTTTAIPSNERHASQRGRKYRCQSQKLTRVTSLDSLTSASDYAFYYDTSNSRLYIKTSNPDFEKHPIFLPTDKGGVYGNDGTCEVEFINIETWYAPFIVNKCHGASVVDCAAKFALGTGGFRYDDSLGIKFIRCEACATNHLSGYGDGINGHSYLDNTLGANEHRHIYVSAEMIDCWCHDNADDGWSDHTGCKSIVRGGLYEYNTKGGVTPSGGTSCECYNVLSRKNHRGFYYISSSGTTSEKIGELYAQNCIAKNNSIAGFDASSNSADLEVYCELVDCKSISNPIGFRAGEHSVVNLLDCSAYNTPSKMTLIGTGFIESVDTDRLNDSGDDGDSVTDIGIDTGSWELGAIDSAGGNIYSNTRLRTVTSIDVTAYDTVTVFSDSSVYKVALYYYEGEPIPGGDNQYNGSFALNKAAYDTSGELTVDKSGYPTMTHLRIVIAHIDDSAINVSEADVVSIVGTCVS